MKVSTRLMPTHRRQGARGTFCGLALLVSAVGCTPVTPTGDVRNVASKAQPPALASVAPRQPPHNAASSATFVGAISGNADDDARSRLRSFFAKFVDSTDFGFLRDFCRPTMDRFIQMHNIDIGAVIESARGFFHDKRDLAYEPDWTSVHVARQKGTIIVDLPVRMTWSTPIPSALVEKGGPLVVSGDVPYVRHVVTVDVEVTFDNDLAIIAYAEALVHTSRLRVTGEEECDLRAYAYPHDPLSGDEAAKSLDTLIKDAVVIDLGDTFEISGSTKGTNIVRKVKVGGRAMWMDDVRMYTVANPGGGTSAGESKCLLPMGVDGGP